MTIKKLLIALQISLLAISCSSPHELVTVDCLPPIWPDYEDVTIPVNIAPLNFGVRDSVDCKSIFVTVTNENGDCLMTAKGKDAVNFKLRKWHRMLSSNAGHSLILTVSMKSSDGWKQYRSFRYHVSADEIDYGLTYRLIMAGYQSFGHMGIYERRLSDFRQKTLIDNRMTDDGCVNCHTSRHTSPSSFSLHVRGKYSATLLCNKGKMECLNTVTDSTGGFFVYPYWHPSDEYVAYSVNKTKISFYQHNDKKVEVYDQASDVLVYQPATHEVLLSPLIRRKDKFETYPAFSADGKTLYFCSSNAAELPKEMSGNQYSLCSIAFDAENGTFGEKVDTLLNGPQLGLSFCTPRPSYDGKYILLAGMTFGTFPLWHKEADLYLYDIEKAQLKNAEVLNSPDSESFHNWSSDSKWVVFSSRRDDGLYTKLYISHFDERGEFSKPFILPQLDPVRYYDGLEYSYNIPDFTSSAVPFDVRDARDKLVSGERVKVHLK